MQTLFIEPGSPWENGYVESFNGKLRDELLDREIFYTLTEAQILNREMAEAVQHGATAQCAGLSTPNARGGRADTDWRVDHELSSLIRTGTTTGGRSLWSGLFRGERVRVTHRRVALHHVGESQLRVGRLGLIHVRLQEIEPSCGDTPGSFPGVVGRSGRHVHSLLPRLTTLRSQSMTVALLEMDAGAALRALAMTS